MSGPSVRQNRLIYTAVVRPPMTYGSRIWAVGKYGKDIPASTYNVLLVAQNKCPRKVLGAYIQTSTAALEIKSSIPQIRLYIPCLTTQKVVGTSQYEVTKEIKTNLGEICKSVTKRPLIHRRRAPRTNKNAKPSMEKMREKSIIQNQHTTQRSCTTKGSQIQARSSIKELARAYTTLWETKWKQEKNKPSEEKGFSPRLSILASRTSIILASLPVLRVGVDHRNKYFSLAHTLNSMRPR